MSATHPDTTLQTLLEKLLKREGVGAGETARACSFFFRLTDGLTKNKRRARARALVAHVRKHGSDGIGRASAVKRAITHSMVSKYKPQPRSAACTPCPVDHNAWVTHLPPAPGFASGTSGDKSGGSQRVCSRHGKCARCK